MASNIGYQAVDRGIHDEVVQALPRVDRWDDWIWNFLKGGTLSEEESVELRRRLDEFGGTRNSDTFLIHAESVRQIAYVIFWLKIIFAAIFTKLMITPSQIEDSDLKRMFGYNNICVLFDYSPSREYVAMIYPLFEYAFFYYVVLDYIHLRLSVKNSSHQWLLTMGTFALPFKLLFIGWFRMIFVYNIQQPKVPFGVRGVVGHTLAFFGLQIALIMVAFENIAFIWFTGIMYPNLGSYWTKRLAALYFFLFVLNSTFQMAFAFGIFMGNDFLNVSGENPNQQNQMLILFVDRMWLLLVGIMPIWFAQVGRKTQAYVKITLELNSDAWEDPIENAERTVTLRGIQA